jgi:hypothetical protein
MTNIVRSTYRYKRPPKRKKAVPLEVPAVLTISDKTRKRVAKADQLLSVSSGSEVAAVAPATDDRKSAVVTAKPVLSPVTTTRPSAIVTARKPGKRYVDVPEVSADEHRRVGDLADAMMQEFKRKIAEKIRS